MRPARRAARKRKGLGNWRLVRYADDFVLLVSGERRHADDEEVVPELEAALDQLTAAGCDAVCVSESFGVDDASLEVLALQAARDRAVHALIAAP